MPKHVPAATAAAAAAFALALPAAASSPPSAFGHARQGVFELVSGAVLESNRAHLMGTFSDPNRPCSATLRIRVSGELTYLTFSGQRKRVTRAGTFTAVNCAEGGPNRGFTVVARSVGLACASGRWQRGRYSFVTETFDPRTKLRAVASLLWSELDRC